MLQRGRLGGAPRGGVCAADPWSGEEEERSEAKWSDERGVGGGLGPPPCGRRPL